MNQIQEILISLNTEYKKYISNLNKDDLKELNLRKIKKLRLYGIFSSYYYKATLPAIPKSRVAVAMPNALNIRLIVGMLMLYPMISSVTSSNE